MNAAAGATPGEEPEDFGGKAAAACNSGDFEAAGAEAGELTEAAAAGAAPGEEPEDFGGKALNIFLL